MLTLAVSVTLWPGLDGFREDVTVRTGVWLASCTTCDVVALPAANDPSPPYRASIVRVPGSRPAVVSMALPPLRSALPMSVPPSKNCTIPDGVPADGGAADTVAVN